ncbi:helix-turn-helix transcriptional regulator [Flagellimonas allohymeniacidonis]|uniref:AraC family transcriptional regulator n=1 Tax=Flagellimonas allohymeniacidonis TaxID=2517819 RepID=A0A4Q8QJZ2_9FLAO|nr:AraC family transcriptional regulator [Allomuricauda hymeniacidonis]TAI48819.1 AraC family transcriptional regulator [Allomuricauda hymeniacidonis]
MKGNTSYFKGISELLDGLKTVKPLSEHFHIHKFSDTPNSWLKETQIFRSNTYAIILMIQGEADYKIGLSDYHIGDSSLYFMAPAHLRYYNRLSEWDGYVLLFMDEFILNNSLKKLVTGFKGFKISSEVVINLNKQALEESERIFKYLYDVSYSDSKTKFKKAEALLELLMIHMTELYDTQFETQNASKPHRIFKMFEHIVEDHLYAIIQDKAEKQITIGEIAERIHVNSTYLGEVIKKATGRTPKEILSDRFVLEAKSLLGNTDMAVNEIAYFLKFQDASNFTKFFRAKTGISPTKYRNFK